MAGCLACCLLAAAACESEVPSGQAHSATGNEARLELDRWVVTASVESVGLEPVQVVSSELRLGSRRAWIEHILIFRNSGRKHVAYRDSRAAFFMPDSSKPVLAVADTGCGIDRWRKRFQPICAMYYQPFVVPPGRAARYDTVLVKGVKGMLELVPGTYRYERRFWIEGRPAGRAPAGTVTVTYRIERAEL